jgi:hypothetical protein
VELSGERGACAGAVGGKEARSPWIDSALHDLYPSGMERKAFNPKRRLQPPPTGDRAIESLEALASRLRYVGNPLHKRGPGDFGLDPPAALRQGKSVCDGVVDCKSDAQTLLKEGAKKGLVSMQTHGEFPQNVWAVAPGGIPLEAMLDNFESGTYHGYPMPEADPLRTVVIERWRLASPNT